MRPNDTSLNILCSYAHLYRSRDFDSWLFSMHRSGEINLMIDSGAFTKLGAKSGNFDFINVDTYSDWIAERESSCEKYVMLDVIGNSERTRRNYETMVSRGLKPMWVVTAYDNDWGYLRQTMSVNLNCCVAGGTRTKGDWMKQRFQRVFRESGDRALIHGLGYVIYPDMLRLPLASVDSTSWNKGAAYGNFRWFDERSLRFTHHSSLLKRGGVSREVAEQLDRWEITPPELREERYWHGTRSIAMLSSIVAFLRYQRYAYRHGLRLFFAVQGRRQVEVFRYVNENINTITYEQFRKAF